MSCGRTNYYYCNACGRHITTIDVDDGVTPMFIACWATKGCAGWMHSSMYRLPAGIRKPNEVAWEWYRPRKRELSKMSPCTKQHVRDGGLLLRPKKRRILDVD